MMIDESLVFTLHAIIDGHVQGVGFRYFVKDNADYLHLTGWVRNLYNGSVELTAEGDHEALDRLLEAVRLGPNHAVVTDVKCDWSSGKRKYIQFSFLPTE